MALGDTLRSRSWLPLLVPVLLVAIVLSTSLFADGRRPTPGRATGVGAAVTLSRTLSCIADGANPSMRVGTVPTATSGYTAPTGPSGRVTFDPAVASKGYGTQWASGTGWLAARSCPEPADDWWFVGVGAGVSHRSVVTLDNPRSNDASVTVTVFGPQGQVPAPGLNDLSVPARQSLTLDLEAVAPSLGELAVHISAGRGLVSASVWENWALSPLAPTVSAWVPPAPQPATQVQVIGVPAKVNAANLVVTNPSGNTVVATLTATSGTATFTPAAPATITIPPESTVPVDLGPILAAGFASVTVSSNTPITTGLRTARGAAEAYATAGMRIGAGSTVGLPGGLPMTLQLMSATATTVQVTAVDANGSTVLDAATPIAAATAVSVALPPTAVAVRLTGPADGGAIGSVLLDNGAIAVLPVVPTASASMVPPVVPKPY